VKTTFNGNEPFLHVSDGNIPRELEKIIDHATKEEFEAELRRLRTLQLLHKTGGIDVSEEMQIGDGKARLLEERDVRDILEVLFTEEHYRAYPERVKDHLTRLAKRGLGKYENILVAERDGKAVARALLDTSYPPYAEIGIDLVHSKYRTQEEDIWAKLVEGCILLARQFDCNVMYAMDFKNSPTAQPFYEKYGAASYRVYGKFGFQPAMLQGFEDYEKEICLFRFSDMPCYNEFIQKHPLSILSVSGGMIDFHGSKAYEMKWSDPQTDDFLAFYLHGKRHESMPRITGMARKEKAKAFDAWVDQVTSDVAIERSGKFKVCLKSRGSEKLKLLINFLLPKDTTLDDQPSKTISSELDKEESWELKFDVKPEFGVPALSFWTVLVTCQLQLNGFSSSFPMSAGFEMDRPPMKRKK